MSIKKLKRMTTDQLVDLFASFGVAQDEALLDDEIAKYNKLYGQMDEIDLELRARGPDARRALLRLFDHPNAQVRVRAAARTLSVAPAEARGMLQEIKDSKEYPQAAAAAGLISGLEDGTFVPK